MTPLARWELIAGKLLPYATLGMLNVLLVVTVAVFWFEVPFRGSVGLLLLMSLVYLMTTLGIGLSTCGRKTGARSPDAALPTEALERG